VSEVGVEGLAEELKDTTLLLATGRQHRPDAFAPTLSALATGSLCDVTIDDEYEQSKTYESVGPVTQEFIVNGARDE